MKPTNWSTMISGPGVVSAMPRPSSISPGLSHPNVCDGFLRDVGQDGIGAAERHHGHFREEHGDLAEHVAGPKSDDEQAAPARSTA